MILISSGEPSGIGPDIILKLIEKKVEFSRPFVVLGDCNLFQERATLLNINVNFREYSPGDLVTSSKQSNDLWVWPISLSTQSKPGVLNQANASYVLNLLKTGADACMKGIFDALVTAPIHKGVINDAGVSFSGHTEYFAELTHTPEVVMMLASDTLRVALVTTHLPLRAVPDAITAEKLEVVIHIIRKDFAKYFNDINPNIYVAGLNPHAGEGGHLGREEIEVISPVLKKMQKNNWNVHGPFPADTLFTPFYQEKADVFLAMYHDQGLSVLKYAAFDEAVNITLGLPFIRTSVDHGTALDLAGTGRASEHSLIKAIEMAIRMSSSL
jgi:4-hydroxythreonine-4-phosphate dehydrogenase